VEIEHAWHLKMNISVKKATVKPSFCKTIQHFSTVN